MKKYVITGLRGIATICEEGTQIFIGNHNYKLFNSKKEALEFKKTSNFKVLDRICPCEWHIGKIEVEE